MAAAAASAEQPLVVAPPAPATATATAAATATTRSPIMLQSVLAVSGLHASANPLAARRPVPVLLCRPVSPFDVNAIRSELARLEVVDPSHSSTLLSDAAALAGGVASGAWKLSADFHAANNSSRLRKAKDAELVVYGNLSFACVCAQPVLIIGSSNRVFIHFSNIAYIVDESQHGVACLFSLVLNSRQELKFLCNSSAEYLQWIEFLERAFSESHSRQMSFEIDPQLDSRGAKYPARVASPIDTSVRMQASRNVSRGARPRSRYGSDELLPFGNQSPQQSSQQFSRRQSALASSPLSSPRASKGLQRDSFSSNVRSGSQSALAKNDYFDEEVEYDVDGYTGYPSNHLSLRPINTGASSRAQRNTPASIYGDRFLRSTRPTKLDDPYDPSPSLAMQNRSMSTPRPVSAPAGSFALQKTAKRRSWTAEEVYDLTVNAFDAGLADDIDNERNARRRQAQNVNPRDNAGYPTRAGSQVRFTGQDEVAYDTLRAGSDASSSHTSSTNRAGHFHDNLPSGEEDLEDFYDGVTDEQRKEIEYRKLISNAQFPVASSAGVYSAPSSNRSKSVDARLKHQEVLKARRKEVEQELSNDPIISVPVKSVLPTVNRSVSYDPRSKLQNSPLKGALKQGSLMEQENVANSEAKEYLLSTLFGSANAKPVMLSAKRTVTASGVDGNGAVSVGQPTQIVQSKKNPIVEPVGVNAEQSVSNYYTIDSSSFPALTFPNSEKLSLGPFTELLSDEFVAKLRQKSSGGLNGVTASPLGFYGVFAEMGAAENNRAAAAAAAAEKALPPSKGPEKDDEMNDSDSSANSVHGQVGVNAGARPRSASATSEKIEGVPLPNTAPSTLPTPSSTPAATLPLNAPPAGPPSIDLSVAALTAVPPNSTTNLPIMPFPSSPAPQSSSGASPPPSGSVTVSSTSAIPEKIGQRVAGSSKSQSPTSASVRDLLMALQNSPRYVNGSVLAERRRTDQDGLQIAKEAISQTIARMETVPMSSRSSSRSNMLVPADNGEAGAVKRSVVAFEELKKS
ncbi:hypothetical protein HDU82_007976 [Entophlyctis luteolus]|nr:hypothetical protein HDU82_007976 [Entophlyctis luteolus]